MMEADIIIESAQNRIKRMEAVENAQIEEVTSLKASIRGLHTGRRVSMSDLSTELNISSVQAEAAKAVATGRRATDFAKEFKSTFDGVEKELRDGEWNLL
jgi:aconitase B